jgi:hypothetical protein
MESSKKSKTSRQKRNNPPAIYDADTLAMFEDLITFPAQDVPDTGNLTVTYDLGCSRILKITEWKGK